MKQGLVRLLYNFGKRFMGWTLHMIMCVLLCYPVSIHMSQLLSTGYPISSSYFLRSSSVENICVMNANFLTLSPSMYIPVCYFYTFQFKSSVFFGISQNTSTQHSTVAADQSIVHRPATSQPHAPNVAVLAEDTDDEDD